MIFKIPAGVTRVLLPQRFFFLLFAEKIPSNPLFRPFSRQLILYHYKGMGTNCDNGLLEITYSLAL